MTKVLTEREVITQVLELYKESSCLWDPNNKKYRNQCARNEALETLRECFSKYRDISVDDMKKKIEHMRAAFRRERVKVEKSRLKGGGTDKYIYRPSLWYYKHLTFLNGVQLSLGPQTYKLKNDDNDESECELGQFEQNEVEPAERNVPEIKKPRRSKPAANENINKQADLVQAAQKILENSVEDDSAVAFGRYVTSQLKEINDKVQHCLAEKLIQETLFHAKLNHLTFDTNICLNLSQYNSDPLQD